MVTAEADNYHGMQVMSPPPPAWPLTGAGAEANGVMNDIRFRPFRGMGNYSPLFRDAVGTDTSARNYKTTAHGCEPPAPVLGTAGKNEEKARQ